MPNYFALARSGVVFSDHHAVYPTFTMMNSASIATGTYPGTHGFYGNVVYAPNAKGKNAKGVAIDFSAPAFIEDFGVVEGVRDSHRGSLAARVHVSDRRIRELHPSDEKAGSDDLLVEGARRNESRVRPRNV